MRKIRIVITGIWYAVAMCRYFWEALLRRSDVQVWCAGPYTHRWIPWLGGMTLPESYVRTPEMPLAMTNPPSVIYSVLEKAAPWKPDLWLEINAGLNGIGKPTNAPLAVVATDPHVLPYDDARDRADFFFNMQRHYSQKGDIWLPYAYDPTFCTPSKIPFAERIYDCALVGLPYPIRQQIMDTLKSHGRNVFLGNGPAYEDAAAVYHQTRVGLNWASADDMNCRFFELMALGLPAITSQPPDAVRIFGLSLVNAALAVGTAADAVQAVNVLLDDPARAERMGQAATELVQGHTWDARVDQIVRMSLGGESADGFFGVRD